MAIPYVYSPNNPTMLSKYSQVTPEASKAVDPGVNALVVFLIKTKPTTALWLSLSLELPQLTSDILTLRPSAKSAPTANVKVMTPVVAFTLAKSV